MSKSKKKFFGLLGLGAVALMTIVAIFLPDQASATNASDSHTDVIKVTVYDQKPTVRFVSPEEGYTQSNPLFDYHLSYSYTEHLYFKLSYWVKNEGTGEPELKTIDFHDTAGDSWAWTPDDLDPTFNYSSGELNVEFNLATCKAKFGNDAEVEIPNCEAVREGGIHFDSSYLPTDDNRLGYNCYGLEATVVSGGGMGTSNTYFCYTPSSLVQTGSDPDNNDPIVRVTTDTSVAQVGLFIYDENWNLINSDPLMITSDKFVLVDPVTGEIIPAGEGTGTGTGSSSQSGDGQSGNSGTSGDGQGTGQNPSGDGSGTTSGMTGRTNNTGLAILTLPFGSYGLPSGRYYVRIAAYDENGQLIESPERLYYQDEDGNIHWVDTAYYPVDYVRPEAPAIPDTGRFLQSLGVSRTDTIITGVIIFAFVTGLAFILIVRSKNSNKTYARSAAYATSRKTSRSAKNARSYRSRSRK